MVTKTVAVPFGLESRPSALFVQNAGKYKSDISIAIDNIRVNAKSIMGVISLAVLDNQVVTLTAEGEDENEAIEQLVIFLGEKHH